MDNLEPASRGRTRSVSDLKSKPKAQLKAKFSYPGTGPNPGPDHEALQHHGYKLVHNDDHHAVYHHKDLGHAVLGHDTGDVHFHHPGSVHGPDDSNHHHVEGGSLSKLHAHIEAAKKS